MNGVVVSGVAVSGLDSTRMVSGVRVASEDLVESSVVFRLFGSRCSKLDCSSYFE